MTDFLTSLASRTLGLSQVIKPRLDPVFAPPTPLVSEAAPSLLETGPASRPENRLSNQSTAGDSLPPATGQITQPSAPVEALPPAIKAIHQDVSLPASQRAVSPLVEPAGKTVHEPARQLDPGQVDIPAKPEARQVQQTAPPAETSPTQPLSVISTPATLPAPPASARPTPISPSPEILSPEKPAQTSSRPNRPDSASSPLVPATSGPPEDLSEISGQAEAEPGAASTLLPAEPVEIQPGSTALRKHRPEALARDKLSPDLTGFENRVDLKPGSYLLTEPQAKTTPQSADPAPARAASSDQPVEGRRPEVLIEPRLTPVEPIPGFPIPEKPAQPQLQSGHSSPLRPLVPADGPLVPLSHPQPLPQAVRPVEPYASTPEPEAIPTRPAPRQPAASIPVDRQAEAPTLQVTIGRVEVRAVTPPTPSSKPSSPRPVLSLGDYLKQRQERRR